MWFRWLKALYSYVPARPGHVAIYSTCARLHMPTLHVESPLFYTTIASWLYYISIIKVLKISIVLCTLKGNWPCASCLVDLSQNCPILVLQTRHGILSDIATGYWINLQLLYVGHSVWGQPDKNNYECTSQISLKLCALLYSRLRVWAINELRVVCMWCACMATFTTVTKT